MKAAARAAHKIINRPWKHVVVAAAGLGISYGLASLAIDSGSLLQYFGALLFLVIGMRHLVWAFTKGYAGKN